MIKCGLTHSGWYCVTHKRTFPVQEELVCCSYAKTQSPATSDKKPNFNSEIKIADYKHTNPYINCVGCSFLLRRFECSIFYHCGDRPRRAKAIEAGCKYRRPKPVVLTEIPASCYLTTTDLVNHTQELMKHLPMNDIDTVVGCARSGLLPASIIATAYGKQLAAYSKKGGLVDVGSGRRLGLLKNTQQERRYKYLLVDDSLAGGTQLAETVASLSQLVPPSKILTAVIYANPDSDITPNFAYAHYRLPHFFEWNLFNCWFTHQIAFDLDGIICEDPPPQCWKEGVEYEEWLDKAEPKHIPMTEPGVVIISARLEKFREKTLNWLSKHGVRVRKLELWNGEPDARWHNRGAAAWKAETFKKLQQEYGLRFFCESDPTQAQVIASCGIKTICPALKQVIGL